MPLSDEGSLAAVSEMMRMPAFSLDEVIMVDEGLRDLERSGMDGGERVRRCVDMVRSFVTTDILAPQLVIN